MFDYMMRFAYTSETLTSSIWCTRPSRITYQTHTYH